jgi:hypothetical protein
VCAGTPVHYEQTVRPCRELDGARLAPKHLLRRVGQTLDAGAQLELKAKLERSLSYFSFTALTAGAFNTDIKQGLTLVHFSAQRQHILRVVLGA